MLELGAKIVGDDDWASVASTKMVLGLVRARQGRTSEAEALLREAVAVMERTDYVAERWQQYLALSKFLVAHGRRDEAMEWMQKTRAITALLGERSPLAAYVERRLAASPTRRRWKAAPPSTCGDLVGRCSANRSPLRPGRALP